ALTAGAAMASLGGAGLTSPAHDSKAALSLRYRIGGDLLLDELSVTSPDLGVLVEASGVISKPLRFALTRGWGQAGLPGMDAELRLKAGMALPAPATLVAGGPELAGAIELAGSLRAGEGVLALVGLLSAKGFGVTQKDFLVRDMSGGLPFDLRVAFDPREDATVLRRNLPLGSGVLAVLTSADDVSQRPARPDYYDRLRPYRRQPGLTIARATSGPYEVENLALEGRLTQGMLLLDWLAVHVLGGDITGNLALQLGRDRSLRGELNFDISNVDASYFKDLHLQPGEDSELNTDLQVGFLFAPKRRDLTLNMNVTRIGSKTFDRFLQLLDPGKKNEGLQNTRGKLWLVRIENVAAWVRYENFNMDLTARPFLRVYPTIDRELLRRHSVSDSLDAYVQPHIDHIVAPLLGWVDSR
ncbi:MAG: hypothetical protein HYZ27_09850, partial [Deltaproteobacteria bacterium]|nr:hypothetical protein [Deltaproteobacteria bacterium]